MLEEGKIYLVKTTRGSFWLFKKYLCRHFRNKITGCNSAICLDDMYKTNDDGYVCNDSEIEYLKKANENYIAIWNREFDDNITLQ